MRKMHLSLSSCCHLCAGPRDAASLTNVSSEKGKQENLQALLNQYIIPILFLPKDDKFCVCDTCKASLLEWDRFINVCKEAQEKIEDASVTTCSQNDLASANKRPVDAASDDAASASSSPRKRRSSNYCIARWCNKGNYQGVSLFRLPKERDRALVWLTAADRSDLKCMATLNSYYLCANHFTSNMFTNKACNQLVRKASPTVFPKSPYADKIALKTATSQVVPTQFQGAQLKSILPKLSVPNNLPPIKFTKVVVNGAQRTRPKPAIALHLSTEISDKRKPTADGQNSCLILETISSKLPSCAVVNQNSVPTTDAPQKNNFAISLDDKSGCNVLPSSSVVVNEGENGSMLYSYVKCSSTPDLEAASEACQTKLKPSNAPIQDQKRFLEEIESCFTTDPYNPSAILSGQESNISQVLKKSSIPFNKQSYQCTNSEIFNVPLQTSHQNDNYQSTVGSQDFLLPHSSDKVKSSPSLTEQSFSLGSTASDSVSDVAHSVSRDSNPILNHSNELNSPHIGLFDLPNDDIQGADNSSFINNMENLDELMDLDKYFEGR